MYGFYFFNSNIGAYTILGSEVYTYTLIPALMILFGKGPATIDKWIYSRDILFSLISVFLFYYVLKDSESKLEWLWPTILMIPCAIYYFI